MASKNVTALQQVKSSIDKKESFVLQGGAGSGKTETLKDTIEYALAKSSNVLCITHTNAAVDEIKKRVEGDYEVSTIHSFLNSLIKDFRRNIKEEIIDLSNLQKMPPIDRDRLQLEESSYKKERHDLYKTIHEKYSIQLYKKTRKSYGKPEGKRNYDKDYLDKDDLVFTMYDNILNKEIETMNESIQEKLKKIPERKVHYNNRKYDNINNLAYGHDSLLVIASRLINKYTKLQKILRDKYDCIFIDEYQDTDPKFLDSLINKFISKNNIIGLFGDSMQAIYDEGISDVTKYIENGKLTEIQKEDNFRSSYEVVNLINQLRMDNLEQRVALKEGETKLDRHGEVKFYYIIKEFERDQKDERLEALNMLKSHALKNKENFVQLELTNSAIAQEMGYTELYSAYKDVSEINEEIEQDLTQFHLKELYEILFAFRQNTHNIVIEKLKYNGWILSNMKDKKKIVQVLSNFSKEAENWSVNYALEYAFKNKVLQQSDGYKNLVDKINSFFINLREKENYAEFVRLYDDGENTFTKITKKTDIITSKEQFEEYARLYKKALRYSYLYSEDFKLREALNFFDYQLSKNNISTMHKTKGEGIENVAVILDNYQWHKYNFDKIFNEDYSNESVKNRTQKLLYVACSRAIKNLILIKIFKDNKELDLFKNKLGKLAPEVFEEVELYLTTPVGANS